MCGLAGVILGRKRRQPHELLAIRSAFTGLLLLNQRRGHHATGVAVLRRDGSAAVFKRPVTASNLIQADDYWQALRLDDSVTVILGHTRFRTRGSERNNSNNHPLVVGPSAEAAGGAPNARSVIYGTHNGTVLNADELFRKFRLPRAAEVDSEILFRMVRRAKNDAEFKSMLALCVGSTSAAWVRGDKPERLRLLKGDMPLDAAYAPRLDAVFYASEAWMLRSVLARQAHWVIGLDAFTLSTFDASSLLDFTQQDVFFLSPSAMLASTP
ncbi:MAG: glucosamine 6-phosphate synthetase [Planctomycetes bacterium]|nr:glucosamine 6-phosphate synthetase [Planctomycetota bacterium]